jgi:hypothetical protein
MVSIGCCSIPIFPVGVHLIAVWSGYGPGVQIAMGDRDAN